MDLSTSTSIPATKLQSPVNTRYDKYDSKYTTPFTSSNRGNKENRDNVIVDRALQ